MKKYNKPEIETLALEMVDVIETSGQTAAASEVQAQLAANNASATVLSVAEDVTSMSTNWSW